MPTATLHAEALHDGLQVKHLLNIARDKLAYLVDDKHERARRLPPLHQLAHAIRELTWANIGFVLDGLDPGVRHWISVGFEGVQHATGLRERERHLPLLSRPLLVEQTPV